MGKSRELFEQWEQEYAEDAEYIAYGLLTDITADICAAMDEQGMKRKELAERLGVSPQYVTKFLNTPENTTVYQVVRFAQAVGLNVRMSTVEPPANEWPSAPASRERAVHLVGGDEANEPSSLAA